MRLLLPIARRRCNHASLLCSCVGIVVVATYYLLLARALLATYHTYHSSISHWHPA
jgi:hypothetical protein